MGSNKLVVFLCLAVLATRTQARSPGTVSEEELEDIFDEVTGLLDNLSETVKDQVETALVEVKGIANQLDDASESIMTELGTSVDGVVKPMVDNLNDVIQEAKNKGLDPSKCVGTSLTDLSELPSSSLEKARKCISSKVNETLDVIDKKIKEINSVLDDITSIGNQLNQCRKQSFLIQPLCIAQVTTDITTKLISLPNKVSSAVSTVAKIVPKNIAGLEKCETGVVDGVRTSGDAIFKKVTDCINKL